MKNRHTISPDLYELVLKGMNTHFELEKPGSEEDLRFVHTDFWLQDTAVIEDIERRSGLWRVSLLFVHHVNPFKFIKRSIRSFADVKKARTAAHYMRRQAAKDQRGTLMVDTSAIFPGIN